MGLSQRVAKDSYIHTEADVLRKVRAFSEIDVIQFGPHLPGMVYIVLSSSHNSRGFGGIALQVPVFDQLKHQLQGRVRFIDIMQAQSSAIS